MMHHDPKIFFPTYIGISVGVIANLRPVALRRTTALRLPALDLGTVDRIL